jgi:AcrR family transcriptional regulator
MVSSMPKAVDIGARRDELAAAAARVIARDGLSGTTMRAVAAEAGWTTGALTHYFANKSELLRFTLEGSLEQRRARRAERDGRDPADALRRTLRRALPTDLGSRRHWTVTIAFCAEAAGDPGLADLQRRSYREFRDDVVGLVEGAGVASGEEARRVAERLIGATNGIAVQALFDPESWAPDRQLDALEEALGEALGP